MISFWRIFSLEFTALVRSKTLWMLLAAALGWMFAAPGIFRGDGTAEGARELALHYSLGGVAALLAVTLVIAAAGSISRERAEKRLALTMVRPVRYPVIALGRIAALASVAAIVLAVATSVEAVRGAGSPDCRHVLKPSLPSPMAEAKVMYDKFMASPETSEKVKQAKKSVVLRLLANRAVDRYDTIGTNECFGWRFRLPAESPTAVTARLRFSTRYSQRDDVDGFLSVAGWGGAVSNVTQAVLEVPLYAGSSLPARAAAVRRADDLLDGASNAAEGSELVFANFGKSNVMLRPRRDVELLLPADSFQANLWRAALELLAMLTLLIAFGVFLGSALGRPAALFTALCTLLLSEMSPSVIEQYPDELESNKLDAIGLQLTRCSAYLTRPVGSLRPLEALSLDECIETDELLRVLALDLIGFPLLFALLSALVMPRKQENV